MKISKMRIAITILGVLIGLGLSFLLPYNSAEKNLATIYYQSYSDFYMEYKNYVDRLSKDDESANNLEKASRLESILNSIRMFKIAQQTSFRNTLLFEKVLKEEIWEKNLTDLILVLETSREAIESKELINNREFILVNEDLLESIEPETLGYNTETKSYEVSLKEGSEEKIIIAIKRLKDILKK